MQGEGQEFESPRLHQHRRSLEFRRHPRLKSNRSTTRVRNRIAVQARVSICQRIDPLIRALEHRGHRPAARWRRSSDLVSGAHGSFRRAAPLQLEDVRSVVNRIFDFAESRQGYDPDRSRPRLAARSDAGGGQATKGTGWMPWRQEPMKDVAGCEKLRGVASRHRSGDVRMGKPGWRSPAHPWLNQIGQVEVSQRTETSQ